MLCKYVENGKIHIFAEKEDILSGFHDSTYIGKNYLFPRYRVLGYLLVETFIFQDYMQTSKRTYLLLTKNELYLFT